MGRKYTLDEVRSALNAVYSMLDSVEQGHDNELVNLEEELQDARSRVAELLGENAALESKVEELEDKIVDLTLLTGVVPPEKDDEDT